MVVAINQRKIVIGLILIAVGGLFFVSPPALGVDNTKYSYWVSSEQVYEQTPESIETETQIAELSAQKQEMVYESIDSNDNAHFNLNAPVDIARNQVVNVNGVYYSVTVDGPNTMMSMPTLFLKFSGVVSVMWGSVLTVSGYRKETPSDPVSTQSQSH